MSDFIDKFFTGIVFFIVTGPLFSLVILLHDEYKKSREPYVCNEVGIVVDSYCSDGTCRMEFDNNIRVTSNLITLPGDLVEACKKKSNKHSDYRIKEI